VPLVLVALHAGTAAQPAAAQESRPATVSHVVDGDTLDAQLSDGSTVRVRLIGIDTPELGACGADRATAALEQLVLGRAVTLVPDPTQGAQDRFGRALFYVDRDDGLDAGRELLRTGWAELLVVGNGFQRVEQYRGAARQAVRSDAGVHARCGGDFSRSREDELLEPRQLLERRLSAVAFTRRYYARVSSRRFAAAWGMLGRRVRRELGPLGAWRAAYRRSAGVSVRSARARSSGRRAVVSLRVVSRDRDACSGRVVRQRFRGRWVLAPRRGSWVAVRTRMRKTGGGRVRLTRDECGGVPPAPSPPSPSPPVRSPPAPRPPQDCQGYDPCLPPGPDVDCAGGAGNGPRYVHGPVYVTGADPYGLDGDGDGVACEP
jgi:endonuclease YncB( thermonuclease family)